MITNILNFTLEQAFIFLPLVLGIYLSYSVLKITDLSVDGSFVFGAGTYAKLLSLELVQPLLALIVAILAGCCAGVVVGIMQRREKLEPLLVSVIALFMFYSINLNVMGSPNINLQNFLTLEQQLSNINFSLFIYAVSITLLFAMMLLLRSNLGLTFRAFGSNKNLLSKLGKNIELYRILGLSISNGLAALSGVFMAQTSGFADINMGFGVALIGIGSVVIGKKLLSNVINVEQLKCFAGIFLYFLILNLLLQFNINPINVKLILGIMLILILRTSATKQHTI